MHSDNSGTKEIRESHDISDTRDTSGSWTQRVTTKIAVAPQEKKRHPRNQQHS